MPCHTRSTHTSRVQSALAPLVPYHVTSELIDISWYMYKYGSLSTVYVVFPPSFFAICEQRFQISPRINFAGCVCVSDFKRKMAPVHKMGNGCGQTQQLS